MLFVYSNLEWAAFECELQFLEPAFFDEFIGAVLRSALGYSLKTISDPPSYRYLFETPPTRSLPGRRYSSVPHPFALRVPCQGQTWLTAGESLRFRLTLIGRGISYFSYFLEAFIQMGKRGIGLKRSRFTLIRVESIGLHGERRLAYSGGDTSYSQRFFRISLNDIQRQNHPKQILLSFLTPVRLKAMGKLVVPDRFTFEAYLRRSVERIRALGYFHHKSPWFDVDGSLIERSREVQSENCLRWQDWEFHVNRRSQKLGGLVGQVTLRGELSPFCQALEAAKWLNVGKNTSYGFGAVDIQY